MTTRLLDKRQRRCDGVAIEVEGDGAVEIRAVDVDSGGLQAGENVGFRQTERRVESN